MANRRTYNGFRVDKVVITNDFGETKEFNALINDRGYIVAREELTAILKAISPFYNIPEIPYEIEKANSLISLEEDIYYWLGKAPYNVKKVAEGQYTYNLETYRLKQFSKDKGHWSFKCENCNKTVSSKTAESYVTGYFPQLSNGFSRCCSVECAEKVSREVFNEFLQERGYTRYFEK